MVRLTMIARASDGLPLAEGLDSGKDPAQDGIKQQAKAWVISGGPRWVGIGGGAREEARRARRTSAGPHCGRPSRAPHHLLPSFQSLFKTLPSKEGGGGTRSPDRVTVDGGGVQASEASKGFGGWVAGMGGCGGAAGGW